MVKSLSFKGDPKPKKRKRAPSPSAAADSLSSAPAQEAPTEENDWVLADHPSEVAGPVLLVFASASPTTCLATDANGTVYASVVENIVEGSPASAEPSEVRQVWVANSVVGSGEVSFRGSNGRYLGVDKEGRASAVREARGVEEGLVVLGLDTSAATFHLKTFKGMYLAAVPSPLDPEKILIQAKKDKMTKESAVVIRMQAKFKPKLEQAKKDKAYEKIGRAQIEREAGRTLNDDEVKRLKKARKRGTYHEEMLDVRAKGKHDKFA
ncbi:FRG1-like family-domain-containing protein [Elsinoe ampelina]|uniref:FRG1-like family-domain-containing protein n=1 Tax=Elsinoe ampelina TaxID=302913 RepID=A0A6A6G786_9PEZI|nr:FRG1-like family-domain-containing protein [Elsinoe ampelina]